MRKTIIISLLKRPHSLQSSESCDWKEKSNILKESSEERKSGIIYDVHVKRRSRSSQSKALLPVAAATAAVVVARIADRLWLLALVSR